MTEPLTGACAAGRHDRCKAGDELGGCQCQCHARSTAPEVYELPDGMILMSAQTMLDLIEAATTRGMKMGGELVARGNQQEIEDLKVARIVAENPGIDADKVRESLRRTGGDFTAPQPAPFLGNDDPPDPL